MLLLSHQAIKAVFFGGLERGVSSVYASSGGLGCESVRVAKGDVEELCLLRGCFINCQSSVSLRTLAMGGRGLRTYAHWARQLG